MQAGMVAPMGIHASAPQPDARQPVDEAGCAVF